MKWINQNCAFNYFFLLQQSSSAAKYSRIGKGAYDNLRDSDDLLLQGTLHRIDRLKTERATDKDKHN